MNYLKILTVAALGISLWFARGEVSQAKVITKPAKKTLSYINQQRKKAGVTKLKLSKPLCKAAKIRGRELAVQFSHERPNGKTPMELLQQRNISFTAVGENIGAGTPSVKAMCKAWMRSKGHKRNILSENYKKTGIARVKVKGSKYRYYWVQFFTD
mgnify:CR=1 FL=1